MNSQNDTSEQTFQQPQNAPQNNTSVVSDQEWKETTDAHLYTAIATVFGFGLLVSIIFYLVNKDKGAFIRSEMGKSLSFHIYVLGAYFVSGFLSFAIIGFVLLPAVWVAAIVISFMAHNDCSKRKPSNFYLPGFIN